MVGNSIEITLKEVYNLLQQNMQSQNQFNSKFEQEIALIKGQLQNIEHRFVQAQQAHDLARQLELRVEGLNERVNKVESTIEKISENLSQRDHKTLWAILNPVIANVVSLLLGGGIVAAILTKILK